MTVKRVKILLYLPLFDEKRPGISASQCRYRLDLDAGGQLPSLISCGDTVNPCNDQDSVI